MVLARRGTRARPSATSSRRPIWRCLCDGASGPGVFFLWQWHAGGRRQGLSLGRAGSPGGCAAGAESGGLAKPVGYCRAQRYGAGAQCLFIERARRGPHRQLQLAGCICMSPPSIIARPWSGYAARPRKARRWRRAISAICMNTAWGWRRTMRKRCSGIARPHTPVMPRRSFCWAICWTRGAA